MQQSQEFLSEQDRTITVNLIT